MASRFAIWSAIRTIKGGLGQASTLNMLRTIDPTLTEDDWREALAEARAIIRNRVDELSRPLNRRPIAEEIRDFPVKSPGGFIQQVEVFVRDTGTGLIDTRHYSYLTDTLRARMTVTREVLRIFDEAIAENPEDYPEEVVGVAYVGTHRLVARTP